MSVNWAKTLTICFCVGLILSISGAHASAEVHKCSIHAEKIKNFDILDTPRPVTDKPFITLDGTQKQFSDYEGQVILLNHWAMWCAPCIREMPSIMRLGAEMQDQGVKVIPLSMDRQGPKKVAHFVEKHEWLAVPFYNDKTMQAARAMGISSIPATQIIDKSGMEIGRLVGTYEWDEPEVKELLSCLVNS